MPSSDLSRPTPPDAGFWELASRQPLTALMTELWRRHRPAAIRAATRRYGLIFDRYEYSEIGGFLYMSPRFASESERADRARAAGDVMRRRLWREDLRHWDEVAKPKAKQRHLELERQRPSRLSTRGLAEHLRACWEHAKRAIFLGESRFLCSCVPLGDFVVQAEDWLPDGAARLIDILAQLREQISDAFSPEFQELRAALESKPRLRRSIAAESGEAPREVFAALARARLPPAARTYLLGLARRVVGAHDIASPCGDEVPHLVLASLRELLGQDARPEAPPALLEEARRDVPARYRRRFDALLAEVAVTFRHRDERRLYTLPWALGLCRRAALEAGRRLAERGILQEPAHLLEGTIDEMLRLLRGERVVEAGELARRSRGRLRLARRAPTGCFGDPGEGWRELHRRRLPPEQQRVQVAILACSALIDGGLLGGEFVNLRGRSRRGGDGGTRRLRGVGACPGRYRGTSRVVKRPEDLARLRRGDILVTFFTEASTHNAVLPLLGGLVTERGGVLSHPAIAAREYGFPAVVGVGGAMDAIRDGAEIVVDGGRGCIEIL
jgi:rifampicin phosphotransferase